MLKWTSESEYFLSFEKKFADTIYHIIQSKSNHFTPSAAHARRGVKIVVFMEEESSCGLENRFCTVSLHASYIWDTRQVARIREVHQIHWTLGELSAYSHAHP